jgi:hypothetical protein
MLGKEEIDVTIHGRPPWLAPYDLCTCGRNAVKPILFRLLRVRGLSYYKRFRAIGVTPSLIAF